MRNMNNVIGSKVSLDDLTNYIAVEFNDCIGDLLEIDEVQQLDNFSQHINVSRLQHSLNVSYYSFLMARFLGFDYRSAARAGVLHDLYLYDWRTTEYAGNHVEAHPKEALLNAQKLVPDLNEIEEDAIVNHMFPLTTTIPRYKESYIVTIADKYCAAFEVVTQLWKKVFKSKNINN